MDTQAKPALSEVLEQAYESMDGSELSNRYCERHRIDSAAVLTVYSDEVASGIAAYLAPRIADKTVVEIGGGIGLLAFHLGHYAKRVYCIEANPMWTWAFAQCLLKMKPKNVSYLFGTAEEFTGRIRGDVAMFCTHSDIRGMARTASLFGTTVIDVYSEMIASNPSAFDPVAVALRNKFEC